MAILAILIAFLSIMVPGFFLALALLNKTKLNLLEIGVIGFIFGMIFPPTLIWVEGYFINAIHAFTFSAGLYNIDVIALTIIGIVLCYLQGALGMLIPSSLASPRKKPSTIASVQSDHRARISELRSQMTNAKVDMAIVRAHEREEEDLKQKHEQEIKTLKEKGAGAEELQRVSEAHAGEERNLSHSHESEERRLISGEKPSQSNVTTRQYLVWGFLIFLMLITFTSRVLNIGLAPKYFEFDPYFDMMCTSQILSYGYQLEYDHSAWPTYLNGTLIMPGVNAINGTVHRIQPLMPYLEAYWYTLANHGMGGSAININLLATVSSVYGPITAALLVFVVFMFLYHEYGEFPALIGAALAAAMPTLISTFIAGEQLLEPWGIFSLFFLVAAYALAVKYPKEKKFAILAGIAFASTFLGSHYYNVTAGVLALYILVQGVIDTLRKKGNIDFYKMNALVILVIVLFYAIYYPYNATLTNRLPNILGIPSIIGFILIAFIAAYLFEYLPTYIEKFNILKNAKKNEWTIRVAFIVIILLLAILSPLSKPIKDFFALSSHYTTPSTPLFMTVQEYAPTGPLYNFGAAGLGVIAADIGGVDIVIWLVLAVFAAFTLYSVYKGSRSSIFTFIFLVVLAIAAMSEVKYLPHFGVAYLIAIAVIVGELGLLIHFRFDSGIMISLAISIVIFILLSLMLEYGAGIGASWGVSIALIISFIIGVAALYFLMPGVSERVNNMMFYAIYFVIMVAILLEAVPLGHVFLDNGAGCQTIDQNGDVVSATMFCNTLTGQWLSALSWMRTNIGPLGSRVLSWWDYGDWINWFGNSNAVIRGDNAVAQVDYDVAAHYVLSAKDGYGPAALSGFMNTVQAKYVIFDDQLVPKWSALDFLGCVDVNQTSRAFAISQGKQYDTGFVLGTSTCEISHDPVDIAIPENPSINDYCSISNSSVTMLRSIALVGETIPTALNQTFCVPVQIYSYINQGQVAAVPIYYPNGTKSNIVLSSYSSLIQGTLPVAQGVDYLEIMAIYLPNGPNDTITDAPTQFYNSSYYKGFFFGKLPGFTLAYPRNFTGINMVNSTNTVMILESNNFTGASPYHTPKPGWVDNNYTIPA